MYHDQTFPTVESFLEAYNNGTLLRHPEQKAPDLDFSWTQRKRVGQDRDLDELPGPRSVSFSGLRYRVDREQQYVSWMGWGMYLGFDRDMGLNFWDIRFRGQRIIYQVCMMCSKTKNYAHSINLATSSRGDCTIRYVMSHAWCHNFDKLSRR